MLSDKIYKMADWVSDKESKVRSFSHIQFYARLFIHRLKGWKAGGSPLDGRKYTVHHRDGCDFVAIASDRFTNGWGTNEGWEDWGGNVQCWRRYRDPSN